MSRQSALRLDAPIIPPSPLERSAANDLVSCSLKSGWLDRAEHILHASDDPAMVLGQVTRIVQEANESVESAYFTLPHPHDHAALIVRREKDPTYYNAPILAARKESSSLHAPLAAPALHEIYTSHLNLGQPAALIDPKDREDLERIGTARDFLAMMFWAEVHSIHAQQTPTSHRAMFEFLNKDAPPHRQQRLRDVADRVGYHIHVITALDSTDRRAGYHVYIPPEREAAFLSAITSTATVDLEAYGRILGSFYFHHFREQQRQAAHARFQQIIDRYVDLAQRERTYSYTADPAKDFKSQRFFNALEREGSRQALLDELVRQVDEPSPAPSPATETSPVLFCRRLVDDVAGILLSIARERRLTLRQVRQIAQPLIDANAEGYEEMLAQLAAACWVVGNDPEAFDRFILLIVQNRSLNSDVAIAAAAEMAGKRSRIARQSRFAPIIGSLALTGLVPTLATTALVGLVKGIQTSIAASRVDWNAVRTAIAWLDFMMQCTGDAETILRELRTYVDAGHHKQDTGTSARMARVGNQYVRDLRTVSADEIEEHGLSIEKTLERRFLEFYVFGADNGLEHDFTSDIIAHGFIDDIKTICLLAPHIDPKNHSEEYQTVSDLLASSLRPLFDAADFPPDEREVFIERLTDRLLAKPALAKNEAPQAIPLPDSAPVRWKDRAPDDTPATFFGRVYQPWIGRITKNELRSLDPTLVTNINAWVREGNDWPEDLPLPRLHKTRAELKEFLEKIERHEVSLHDHLSSFSGREALREYQRIANAKARLKENSPS